MRVDAGLLDEARVRYLDAVLRGERRGAIDVCLDLLDSGVPAEQVITGLLAPAQVEVGNGWVRGEWSVAMEHRTSAITESALQAVSDAAMRAPGAPAEGSRGRAVVACTEGEWHLLPGRMASEVLRLRGLDVTFVGPSVPATDLAEMLGDDPPPVVGVSCSMPMSLPGALRTITALRAIGMTVVCGGRGFGPDETWSRTLGGDLWGGDLSGGADLVVALAAAPAAPPRGSAVGERVQAELRIAERDHQSVVESAVARALARWPFLTGEDAAIRATREDLSSTLRILAATVTTGDQRVVLEYVSWFESVLAARDLPLWFVPAAFELLLEALSDDLPLLREAARAGLAACVGPVPG
ncbi:MAG: cobalamin-dependent protein [Candidatus Nanopelagicales bacterium]